MSVSETTTMYIDQLPTEVLEHILSFLGLQDRKMASLVSHRWFSLAFSHRYMDRVRVTLRSWKCVEPHENSRIMRPYRHLNLQTNLDDKSEENDIITALDQMGQTVESFTCLARSMKKLCLALSMMTNLWQIELHVDLREDASGRQDEQTFPILERLSDLSIEFGLWYEGFVGRKLQSPVQWMHMLQTFAPQLKKLKIDFPYDKMPVGSLDLRMLEHLEMDDSADAEYGCALFDEASLQILFTKVPLLKTAILKFDMTISILAVIEKNCPMLSRLQMSTSVRSEVQLLCNLRGLEFLETLEIGFLKPQMLECSNPVHSVHNLKMIINMPYVTHPQYFENLSRVFPNLKDFSASGIAFDDYVIRQICMLPQLKRLKLAGTILGPSSSVPNDLAEISCLEKLILKHVCLPRLSLPMNSLQHLEIADVNIPEVFHVWTMFPNLQYLKIPRGVKEAFNEAKSQGWQVKSNCVIEFAYIF